ncbi:hypothetical protein EGW08_004084 [Elysia chlorotica]|uniref:Chromatin target of PRMT1 protein C-terminal domain-containing protein n=1 Tax=Elysia chlorotica TaxID=188477 RepID=A0A3S1BP27_ELYCH|nr:hypothetical protein EGW08_004084 [Elysia chlorotica]
MTTVPTKIVLKSTTRMSLSERFSHIVPTVQTIRSNMAAEQQVSAANRRLAQQLANRPGVGQAGGGNPAAFMYQQQQQQMMMTGRGGAGGAGFRGNRGSLRGVGANKGTLKQRLGKSNVKNRLTLPAARGTQQFARGGYRGGRGARGGSIQALQGGAGDFTYSKPQGRGGFSPARGRGRGTTFRGRGNFNRSDEVFQFQGGKVGTRKPRGGFTRDRAGFTGQTIVRGGRGQRRGGTFRGGQRGQRGRGGRGGRGASAANGGGSMTAHDLDSQLDEYMSKSKSHLDSELDAYMSQVN